MSVDANTLRGIIADLKRDEIERDEIDEIYLCLFMDALHEVHQTWRKNRLIKAERRAAAELSAALSAELSDLNISGNGDEKKHDSGYDSGYGSADEADWGKKSSD